jgi:uncharacterized coiled-coil protein SlyX
MAMPNDERLMRIEENQGFAEHTLEQLNAELVEVNRRIADALTRLERLEHRVERLMGTVTEISAGEAARDEPGAPDQPSSGHTVH